MGKTVWLFIVIVQVYAHEDNEEYNKSMETTCPADRFTCFETNLHSIHKSLLCDEVAHCVNGEDELGCT